MSIVLDNIIDEPQLPVTPKLLKVRTRRMRTSRDGPTKYEHFTTVVRDDGRSFDFWMRHNAQEAQYQSLDLAQFLGLPCDPLVVDGKEIELDEGMKAMLAEGYNDRTGDS